MKALVHVPDYLPTFHCKCGACRYPCCHGWPIALTEDEYFHLIGIKCSPALRRRLDTAIHIRNHPFPENYAELSPNWLGLCPLQQEDGLCSLQCEKGENALPTVCRLYPRSFKALHGPECVCMGSCEAVLEQLYSVSNQLRWTSMTMDMPDVQPEAPQTTAARDTVIAMLQNYSLPLRERIRRLPGLSGSMDSSPVPAIEVLLPLFESLSRDSTALQPLWQQAESLLQTNTAAVFFHYRSVYEERFPLSDRWLEQALVNHVMLDGFPQDPSLQMSAALALGILYALLRFYGILFGDTFEHLVDVHAAVFRRVEHTNFDSVIEAETALLSAVKPRLCEV